jgi:hypothetical protein
MKIEYQARCHDPDGALDHAVEKNSREEIETVATEKSKAGFHVIVYRIGQVIEGRMMPDQYLFELPPSYSNGPTSKVAA